MVRLVIDNRRVEVEQGATILTAAKKLGIEIPTLCYFEGFSPSTSCMVCVVKELGQGRLVPACAAQAEEGMQVESESEEVHQARRSALELLLSDHLGDCIAPCQSICPAHMNIPQMIRQIADGEMRSAIETVKRDIALPAVLGRICPAPCEKGCRRGAKDGPVPICLLKRYAADVDLASEKAFFPTCRPTRNKSIAIVGAGPAGLAAAYYLQQEGYHCVLFDEHEKPGGNLRYAVPEDKLPREVLNAEIAQIEKLGAKLRLRTKIGAENSPSLADLQKEFDAVLLAVGDIKVNEIVGMGLAVNKNGIEADNQTYATGLAGVFAAGNAIRPGRLSVRAVADGKHAAFSIDQYLTGLEVTGPVPLFTTHIGRLQEGEIDKFMAQASNAPPVSRPNACQDGLTKDEAELQSRRCLHCDCRKALNCRLRYYAQIYGANPGRYKGPRRLFEQYTENPAIIYEPGKCIDCGRCIHIAAAAGEKLGLTFIGRGFDVRVAAPFEKSITEGLKQVAAQCAQACPTGALAVMKKPEATL